MWRGEKLDGVRFNFPTQKLAKWPIPDKGILELDLIFTDNASRKESPVNAQDFSRFCKVMQNSTSDAARLTLIKRACQAYFFSISQVLSVLLLLELERSRETALVLLFSKITERDKLFSILTVFSEHSRISLQKKIGAKWFWNNACPAAKYWLDLGKISDRETMQKLLDHQDQHLSMSHIKNVRFARNPAHPVESNKTVQDLMDEDRGRGENGMLSLRCEGIAEFDFVIAKKKQKAAGSADILVVDDVLNLVREQQVNQLKAEIAQETAEIEKAHSLRSAGESRRSKRAVLGEFC
jgi:succinate dehydrogenase flavin-adding protein (antitoxin of CptAB toxin-antitoxin module)